VGHGFPDGKERHIQSAHEEGQAQYHQDDAGQELEQIRNRLADDDDLEKSDNENDGSQIPDAFQQRCKQTFQCVPRFTQLRAIGSGEPLLTTLPSVTANESGSQAYAPINVLVP